MGLRVYRRLRYQGGFSFLFQEKTSRVPYLEFFSSLNNFSIQNSTISEIESEDSLEVGINFQVHWAGGSIRNFTSQYVCYYQDVLSMSFTNIGWHLFHEIFIDFDDIIFFCIGIVTWLLNHIGIFLCPTTDK